MEVFYKDGQVKDFKLLPPEGNTPGSVPRLYYPGSGESYANLLMDINLQADTMEKIVSPQDAMDLEKGKGSCQ